MTRELTLEPGWLQRDTKSAALSVAESYVRAAKRRMDEAEAAYSEAETAWLGAIQERERLEASDSSLTPQNQEKA